MLIRHSLGKRSRWLGFIGAALLLLTQRPMVAAGTALGLDAEGIGRPSWKPHSTCLAELRSPPFSLTPNLSPYRLARETFHSTHKLHTVFTVLGVASTPFSSRKEGILSEEDSVPVHRLNKAFFCRFRDDFVDVFMAPAGWNQRDLFSLSVVLGGGFVFFTTDEYVQDWVQEQRTHSSDDASRYIKPFGNGAVLGSLIVSLYLSGELFHQDSLRHTALQSLESLVISGVLVAGLKFLTGRARPTTGVSPTTFKPFSGSSRYYSLPSGHASSAFAVAAVIADNSDRLWVDVLSYSLAALVAVSRLHDNEHWPSDVFLGGVLGYFVGRRISSAQETKASRLRLTFLPDRSGLALSLSVSL